MIKRIKYEESIKMKDSVYIDVRSPKEYKEDTIPNSINIPLFSNEEREKIGYTYTKVNKEKARRMGLEYASTKLVNYYDIIKDITLSNKRVVLFCYRGGMRSASIAKVLDVMNIPIYIIDGGYKEYRKFVINNLEKYGKKFKYIVLHGYTGVGKTKALVDLQSKGLEVLDLEKIAQNSGSVFGNIFFKEKSSSQKKFESLLLNKFMDFKNEYIFVESESKRIGNAVMPEFLYDNIQLGFHILIETNIENRVKIIGYDYLNNKANNKKAVIKAIRNLKRRLGREIVSKLENEFLKGNYEYVIEELMINYYDPLYDYSIQKVSEYDKIIYYEDIDKLTNKLISFKDNIKEM